jgi:hypothetical protein
MRSIFILAGCAGALIAELAAAEALVELEARVDVGKAEAACEDPALACVAVDQVIFAPFGLSLGRWDLQGATRDYDPTQLTVELNPDTVWHSRGLTTRSRISAGLGGGSSGFAWSAGGVWMFGGRLNLGRLEQSGPFARVGLGAESSGNSDLNFSHLELPRFELGYQLIQDDALFFELAGQSGLMLAGRHHVIDRTRDIGVSFNAGFMATLQTGFLRVHADVSRTYENERTPETAIDRGKADVCGLLGRVAVCLSGSLQRAEVWSNDQAVATGAGFIGGKLAIVAHQITSSQRAE